MGGYCFLSCLKMQYHVRIATKFCGCTSCRSRCNCIRLMAMRSSLVALKFFWGPKLLPQVITRPAMISSEPKFRRPSWALAPVRLPPWLERPRPTSCQQLAHLPTPSCPSFQSRVPSCDDSSSFWSPRAQAAVAASTKWHGDDHDVAAQRLAATGQAGQATCRSFSFPFHICCLHWGEFT